MPPDGEPPLSAGTSRLLEVRHGSRGRGVFARVDLPAGAELERCPVVVVPRAEVGATLLHYVFLWGGEHGTHYALPTGLGLLFNHCRDANARFRCDETAACIVFESTAQLHRGDEVLIDYDYDPAHLELIGVPDWLSPDAH